MSHMYLIDDSKCIRYTLTAHHYSFPVPMPSQSHVSALDWQEVHHTQRRREEQGLQWFHCRNGLWNCVIARWPWMQCSGYPISPWRHGCEQSALSLWGIPIQASSISLVMAWVYESEMPAWFNTLKSKREVPHARKYMHIVIWNSGAWSLRDFAQCRGKNLWRVSVMIMDGKCRCKIAFEGLRMRTWQ